MKLDERAVETMDVFMRAISSANPTDKELEDAQEAQINKIIEALDKAFAVQYVQEQGFQFINILQWDGLILKTAEVDDYLEAKDRMAVIG